MTHLRRSTWKGLSILGLLLTAAPAWGETRIPVSDVEVVQKAELIVVGRLKPDTIRAVANPVSEGRQRCWYLAELEVSRSVAGLAEVGTLPIFIGPDLIASCYVDGDRQPVPEAGEAMEALVAGSYGWFGYWYQHSDVPAEALWLLQRGPEAVGPATGWPELGVLQPGQVRRPEHEEYFLAYRAADPEAAVREAIGRTPELAPDAERYLDQRELERALEIEDASTRAERLADSFARYSGLHWGREAREGLLAAGSAAGPALRRIFHDPAFRHRRAAVIDLWGEIGDREVVGLLVEVLEEVDRFFAAESLAKGWWNQMADPRTSERRERYGELYSALVALSRLGDPQAVPAIERAHRRWSALPDSAQIVEACARALAALTGS